MAVVKELIRTEENGGISFGNYELPTKSKASDFPYQGDVYKVKTFKEITKLERNGMFVYESVPGTAVYSLKQNGTGMEFEVEGGEDAGKMQTNLGGKLSFSVELGGDAAVAVKVEKC